MSAIAIVFCSVIAFVGINHKDNVSLGDLAGSNSSNEQVVDTNVVDTNINKVVEKPATYTYAPGEVMLKKGGSDLNFSYTPDTNAREDEETITPTVTAYEYIFENTMNRASAVNLKEIDTTDVNVSYAWSTSRLDTTQSITTYTNYSLQKMENKGDRAYIYIFVSPTNEKIPTTFTSSIVWWYGVPYEMPIVNNVTNEIEYQTVVDGQKIDKNTLTQPESFTKTENGTEVTYYFDAWFLDKEFTQLVEADEVKTGRMMYARYHNITPNTTKYIHYVDGEYVFSNDDYFDENWCGSGYDYFYDTGITNIVIPTIYNDGTNGEAKVTAIGLDAFTDEMDGAEITSVSMPCTITTIGNNAFYYCSSLTSITLPSSLTTIGNNAFYYCSSLTSITLPSSLTTIGEGAFDSCYNLAEVYNLSSLDIVAGATTYGGVAQYALQVYSNPSESKFTTIDGVRYYKESDSSYIATRLVDQAKTSITLDSRTTSIRNNVFRSTGLTSIDLSKCTNLTTIGEYAFSSTGLTSIDLSKCTNLTTIGDQAFSSCDSLTSITLPSSLTTIGNYAFSSCDSLTSIDLSKCTNLTTIGNSAFSPCDSLTSIDLSKCTNLTTIGNSAFSSCDSLTSITLPSSLTTIGNYAFSSCDSLTSIDLSKCTNLTTIGTRVFYECSTGPTSIDLSKCTNLTTIGNSAFESSSLTSITLPSSVTSIGTKAFYDCTSLTSITLPSSLTTIREGAFSYCSKLVEVYNLSSLDIVAGANTHGCVAYYAGIVVNGPRDESKLVTIDGVDYYKNSETDYMALRLSDKTKTSITLDSRTTSIGNYAFYQNKTLLSVDLSNCTNLTTIGEYAFSSTGLTSIDLSNCTNLTTIRNYAFYYCTSLTSITLPSSVTTIGNNAFHGCYVLVEVYNLSSLDIVAGATTHGNVAYYALQVYSNPSESKFTTIDGVRYYKESDSSYIVTGLVDPTKTSITLDSRTTMIGNYTFYQCINLTSVDLSNCTNLTTIGEYAFYECYSLTSITLPSSVTTIGKHAFSECDSLTSIDLSKCTNLTTIGNYAFAYCSDLTSITLPSSVTTIGGYAFYFCSSLTSVDLSKCTNLTTIGEYAFYECRTLTSITLPSSVIKIGYHAFYHSGLTSLTIQGWDSGTWYKTTSSTNWNNMTNGTEFTGSFADASQNAKWFKGTYGYYNYYWYKVS